MAGRLANITDYQKKKSLNKAEALPGNVPQKIEGASTLQSPSVTEGFQQMGEFKMEQPTLQKVNPNDVYASTRRQALGATSEADAEKGMEYWNASPKEYWTEKIKSDPDNTYYYTQQMLASDETPEEKRKRERREQLGEVFSGLGNLIGNAANLYYTHRGGQYIDLNTANEKHRERMQRLKDKQDALAEQQKNIILNAKLGEMKADRAERVAKDKLAAEQAAKEKDNAFKLKFNAYLKELDNANKMGQIDAQTKANMQRDLAKAKNDKELEAIKAKYDKELEAFKQQNRIALKSMDSDSGKNKKSTFTYNGTAYNKKGLSSMVALYNKLRQDGYAMPKVKGNNVNQYIDAIANSMSKGTYNLGDFSKGTEAKYPEIIDSDLNQENRNGGLGWGNNNESKDETDW